MNPQVINFFRELLTRLMAKSPRFFYILSVVTGLLSFAGFLPSILQSWFNVELPDNIVTMCKDIAKYTTGFFVATLLPAQNANDTTKLPFSTNQNTK